MTIAPSDNEKSVSDHELEHIRTRLLSAGLLSVHFAFERKIYVETARGKAQFDTSNRTWQIFDSFLHPQAVLAGGSGVEEFLLAATPTANELAQYVCRIHEVTQNVDAVILTGAPTASVHSFVRAFDPKNPDRFSRLASFSAVAVKRGANLDALPGAGAHTPQESILHTLCRMKCDVGTSDECWDVEVALRKILTDNNVAGLVQGSNRFDVNLINEEGRTPVSYAAELGTPLTVQMLLEAGADPTLGCAATMRPENAQTIAAWKAQQAIARVTSSRVAP